MWWRRRQIIVRLGNSASSSARARPQSAGSIKLWGVFAHGRLFQWPAANRSFFVALSRLSGHRWWQGILPGGNLNQSSNLAMRAIYWWFISMVGAVSIEGF